MFVTKIHGAKLSVELASKHHLTAQLLMIQNGMRKIVLTYVYRHVQRLKIHGVIMLHGHASLNVIKVSGTMILEYVLIYVLPVWMEMVLSLIKALVISCVSQLIIIETHKMKEAVSLSVRLVLCSIMRIPLQ